MNTKTVYIANDGTEFALELDAESYEEDQLELYVKKHPQLQEVLDHLDSHINSEDDFYGTPHELFRKCIGRALENKGKGN